MANWPTRAGSSPAPRERRMKWLIIGIVLLAIFGFLGSKASRLRRRRGQTIGDPDFASAMAAWRTQIAAQFDHGRWISGCASLTFSTIGRQRPQVDGAWSRLRLIDFEDDKQVMLHGLSFMWLNKAFLSLHPSGPAQDPVWFGRKPAPDHTPRLNCKDDRLSHCDLHFGTAVNTDSRGDLQTI